MKLKKYSPELIVKRYNENNLTMREIVEKTKEIDPLGRGISIGTVQRIIGGCEAAPTTLCILCAALKISPASLFIDYE